MRQAFITGLDKELLRYFDQTQQGHHKAGEAEYDSGYRGAGDATAVGYASEETAEAERLCDHKENRGEDYHYHCATAREMHIYILDYGELVGQGAADGTEYGENQSSTGETVAFGYGETPLSGNGAGKPVFRQVHRGTGSAAMWAGLGEGGNLISAFWTGNQCHSIRILFSPQR